jgi:hypothetical protein
MSTPIPNATVANTTLRFDFSEFSWHNISSFILVVWGAWNWANSRFFGTGEELDG